MESQRSANCLVFMTLSSTLSMKERQAGRQTSSAVKAGAALAEDPSLELFTATWDPGSGGSRRLPLPALLVTAGTSTHTQTLKQTTKKSQAWGSDKVETSQ